MPKQLIPKKHLPLFAAGFLGAACLCNPSLLPSAIAQDRLISIREDFAALGLEGEPERFVPEGLSRSSSPNEGSRGVIGATDDRIPMVNPNYPWSAIGRIVGLAPDDSTYTCTGTLVAPDLVLTNAHCVVNPDTQEFSQTIKFQPNLINGRLADEADLANVQEIFYGTDFQEDSTPPNADDWAFLKLDKPLGEKYGTIGWTALSLATLVEDYDEALIMVGYSGDFPTDNPGETAGVHEGCSILGEVSGSLIHDCDTFGGASGGPILGVVEGEFRIVALNSAERIQEVAEEGMAQPNRVGIINYAVRITRIAERIKPPN